MCPTPLKSLKQTWSNIRRSISGIEISVAKAEKSEKPQVARTPSELTCVLTIAKALLKQIMIIEIEVLDSTEKHRVDPEDLFIAVKVIIKDQFGDHVRLG